MSSRRSAPRIRRHMARRRTAIDHTPRPQPPPKHVAGVSPECPLCGKRCKDLRLLYGHVVAAHFPAEPCRYCRESGYSPNALPWLLEGFVIEKAALTSMPAFLCT